MDHGLPKKRQLYKGKKTTSLPKVLKKKLEVISVNIYNQWLFRIIFLLFKLLIQSQAFYYQIIPS